jgi:hypothetical protein
MKFGGGYPSGVYGQTRDKKSFLLFPKTINGETRWLEVAEWMDMRTAMGWQPYAWCN